MELRRTRRRDWRLWTGMVAVLLCAAMMLALGGWAYLFPHSFAGFIDYAPYNRHLVHDAGAFQLGIAAGLLAAIWVKRSLVAALVGFAVASGLHTLSHYLDRNIGGHDADVPELALFTVIAIVGAVVLGGRKRS